MGTREEIKVGRRKLSVSNLDKVLYPEPGFTKGDVIDYYRDVGRWLLPHLKGRMLTLKRYPNGVEGGFFYEKQCPSHRPDWVKTSLVEMGNRRKKINFCVVDDLETLVWAANLADLELHPSLAKADKPDEPSVLAFDLDPGEPADVLSCARVALWLRDVLDQVGLKSFAKTSGSKGMQLYVPLNTKITYDQTKPLAHGIAQLLEKRHPKEIVSKMRKDLRTGKVFIDWSQNDRHKTTIGVYSLRAKSKPTVSTPLRWDEVEEAVSRKRKGALVFEAAEVISRLKKHGDLFKPVLTMKQRLPSHILEALG